MSGVSREADDERRLEVALEHAWRYFALHSEQRTTVFNFFVASSAFTLSGLGYVLATDAVPRYFGVVAGLGAALLAFTFWKLDQRVVQLIKASEGVIMDTEHAMFREPRRVLCVADAAPVNVGVSLAQPWSYSRSFRMLFVLTGLLGLSGAGASLISLVHAHSRSAEKAPATTNCAASAHGAAGPFGSSGTAASSTLVSDRAFRPLRTASAIDGECSNVLSRR